MLRKKFLTIVILLAILCSLFPQIVCAREYIAEEKAEDNQVGIGNVTVEKQIESVMMPLEFITGPAALAGAAVVKNATKKAVLYSVAAEGVNLSTTYNGTTAVWMNWPAGRYVFGTADPSEDASYMSKLFGSIPVGIVDMVANKVFEITKTLVVLGINIIVLAFNTQWAASVASLIHDITNSLVDFDEDGFFKLFFLLGICGLVLSMVYKLLKAQLTQALTALLISGLVVALIMGWAAECDRAILWTTGMTDSLAGSSMAMLTNAMPLEEKTSGVDPMNEGLRAAGNAAWRTIVVHPWAAALFGTLEPNNLKLTTQEIDSIKRDMEPEDKEKIKGKELYLDTLYLGAAADDNIRTAVSNAVANPEITEHTGHENASVLMQCSTANAGRFLTVALLTLFPALAFFILAVLIGCSIIFCQFALVVMLIFTPFVLLVALFPDSGWNFALGYGKKMLGFLSVKIIYGLFLGVVLFVGTAASMYIQSKTSTIDQSRLGMAMFFLTIMFAGAALWRKKILDMATSFSVNVQSASSKAMNPAAVISEIRRAKRFLSVADFASDYLTRDKKYKEGTPPRDQDNDSDGGSSPGGGGGGSSPQQSSGAAGNGENSDFSPPFPTSTANENNKEYQRLLRDSLQHSSEYNYQGSEDERSEKGFYRVD